MTLPELHNSLFKGYGLDGVMVDSLPPSIVKNKPYVVDEGCFNNLFRFVTLMISMPPMDDIGCDVDVEFDVVFKGGTSNGARPRRIVFMDPALWKYFYAKEGPQPQILEVVSSFATV